MLFISLEYMLLFLPVVLIVYFFLLRRRLVVMAKAWLVAASFFFYNYWNSDYTVILALSVLFNFAVGNGLGRIRDGHGRLTRRALLAMGIAANLGALAYFKYAGFFVENVNHVLGINWEIEKILLPLGISFFTFQQIAYLIDSARGETREYDFLNYALFVSFFPQLIAGPIVHHKEMLSQFANPCNLALDYRNLTPGIFLFIIGLAKKVLLADVFSQYVATGFGRPELFPLAEGWVVSLSYTFQIYFDFSGYMDMALGAGRMFNINLPRNFDSPYKAESVQDFWRRWHMTLSRFLRDYLYIPLGGSRMKTRLGTYRNVMVTFLLCGLWHGAGWLFVLWGGVHGLALCVTRFWRSLDLPWRLSRPVFRTARAVLPRRRAFWLSRFLPRAARVLATFLFVNCAWVLFRAENWGQAGKVLGSVCGYGDWSGKFCFNFLGFRFRLPGDTGWLHYDNWCVYALAGAVIVFLLPRSDRIVAKIRSGNCWLEWACALVAAAVMLVCLSKVVVSDLPSEFIYFNF